MRIEFRDIDGRIRGYVEDKGTAGSEMLFVPPQPGDVMARDGVPMRWTGDQWVLLQSRESDVEDALREAVDILEQLTDQRAPLVEDFRNWARGYLRHHQHRQAGF